MTFKPGDAVIARRGSEFDMVPREGVVVELDTLHSDDVEVWAHWRKIGLDWKSDDRTTYILLKYVEPHPDPGQLYADRAA